MFKVLRPIIRVVILHSGCNVICFNLASWIWFDINSTPNNWLHKYIKASIWHKNILGYLSTEIIWSEKLALRKLFPSQSKSCLQTNTQAYFGVKWRLLWLLSSKHFAVCSQMFTNSVLFTVQWHFVFSVLWYNFINIEIYHVGLKTG